MKLSRREAVGLGSAMMLSAAIGAGQAYAATRSGVDAANAPTLHGDKPLIFGHRGCSARRPEHTLASYKQAVIDGADFIEPDLVATKDGILVIRHENEISGTTNVATKPEFASRRTTKTIDGYTLTGWFTEDFTLAELKTLRAIERLGKMRPESQSYDGQFEVPTFEEMIAFTVAQAKEQGRVIGLVPELKHSTYFASIGLPLEDRFLAMLAAHDYTRKNPVEIQSFETANLRYIRKKLGRPANVKLLQLMGGPNDVPPDIALAGGKTTYGDMATQDGFAKIAVYADIVGPSSRMLMLLDADEKLGKPTSFVADAHAAGLLVRPYTFRPENRFLPADLRGPGGLDARNEAGAVAEMRRYLALGIDGLFTDDPALGRRAVDG